MWLLSSQLTVGSYLEPRRGQALTYFVGPEGSKGVCPQHPQPPTCPSLAHSLSFWPWDPASLTLLTLLDDSREVSPHSVPPCCVAKAQLALTQVLDDTVNGRLEQGVHGIWAHTQHPL